MRLWLRIDEDLLGGRDDSGLPRPESLATVLGWWEEAIATWLAAFGGYRQPSPETAGRVAREMLRALAVGRAEVLREDRERTIHSGS